MNELSSSEGLHLPAQAQHMPTEWKWKRLDKVSIGVYDCPHTTPELTDSGPYVARSQDVRSGMFRTEEAGHVSDSTYFDRIQKAAPQSGDLLYSREGTYFGIAAEVPSGMKVCLGQRMVLIRPDPTELDYRFLRFWLNSDVMTGHLRGFRDGSVAERLNLPSIRAIPVPLPPLPEQQAIAGILGALDDKIEANRRENATLEAMAQALFTSWFVDFDPVRAKAAGQQPVGMDAATAALFPAAFAASAAGDVPLGWKIESLDAIADFLNGLALQRFPPEEDGWLPVIKIAELRRGNTEGSDRASGQIDTAYIVEDGDVLFSWSGTLEADIWMGGRGALNQHLFKVTSAQYPKWFFYFWIQQHLPDFRGIASDKATTMGHIQRKHLTAAQTTVPPIDLLEAADSIIAPLMLRVEVVERETRTLTTIRDTLLPKLLSGEVRVSEAEEVVNAAM